MWLNFTINLRTEHITLYVLGKGFVVAQNLPTACLRGQNPLFRIHMFMTLMILYGNTVFKSYYLICLICNIHVMRYNNQCLFLFFI